MSEITNQLIYMPSSDWLLRTNWAKRRIQIRIVAPWQLSVVDCNNQQQKKKKKGPGQSLVWTACFGTAQLLELCPGSCRDGKSTDGDFNLPPFLFVCLTCTPPLSNYGRTAPRLTVRSQRVRAFRLGRFRIDGWGLRCSEFRFSLGRLLFPFLTGLFADEVRYGGRGACRSSACSASASVIFGLTLTLTLTVTGAVRSSAQCVFAERELIRGTED